MRSAGPSLAAAHPAEPLRHAPQASTWRGRRLENQGSALLHILQDVAQHHGQAELTRDLLLSAAQRGTANDVENDRDT